MNKVYARYEIWVKRDFWSMKELAYLLEGFEPTTHSALDSEFRSSREFLNRLRDEWKGYAIDIAANPNIHCTMKPDSKTDYLEYRYASSDLLAWAEKKNFRIPTRLQSAFRSQKRPKQQSADDLDWRERDTLLLIIAAMAKSSDLDLSQAHKAAASVQASLELIGARRSINTIADKLKAAYQLYKEKLA